jgi:hypothetical protein
LWAWSSGQAHDVISTKITWTQEISRIVYSRCASCHRDGGKAPMAFLTYEQVRPWAKAIKEEVHERRMPPWGAMKGFGEFLGDHSLSAEEIHLIGDWVEGGAPEGDSQYFPAAPLPVLLRAVAPGPSRVVRDGQKLGPLTIGAIQPTPGLAAGATFQAVAILPDGSTIPLLWLYDFQPKQARRFLYREPVRLPAGSVVRIAGAANQVLIFTASAPKPDLRK